MHLGRLVLSVDPTGLKQLYFFDERGESEGSLDDLGRIITEYRYTRTGQRSQTIQRSSSLSPAQLQQLMDAAKLNSAATALPAQIKPAELAVWDSATAYQTGQQVSYLGRVHQARFDHSGAEPANSNAWLEVVAAGKVADWSRPRLIWRVKQSNWVDKFSSLAGLRQRINRGVHYSWAQVPPAGANPPWMAGVAYEAGQIVEHDGQNGALTGRPVAINPGALCLVAVQYLLAAIHPGRPAYNISKTRWSITMVSIGKARWPSFGDIPRNSGLGTGT